MMTPSLAFATIWAIWAISWILAAAWASSDVGRLGIRDSWAPYGLIVFSIVEPMLWRVIAGPSPRWWDVGPLGAYVLAAAAIPGFVLAWWARLHLGRLWSAAITRKRNHRVVDTGPYAWVRHPIYTGLLWSALVTDVAGASLPALVSLLALALGFWIKAGIEERFLADSLGTEAYAAYRRRVPMLIPSLQPRRR